MRLRARGKTLPGEADFVWDSSFDRCNTENKKLQNARASQSSVYKHRASALHSYLLSSRLYCRLRSFTESCLSARGLYHR